MNDQVLNVLMGIEIVVAVLLVVSILLQNRAEGLGQMFGGGGEVYRTKRGFEKLLYYATIILAVLLATLSFIIVKYTQ
ncbi:MAG: preprotein translocase subunit SecG [Candidatus Dojkabacteria bacterium]|nr:MAG: preprotein translocase subunit SecG [Candidatus Dojkabacteria bacterium]